MKRFIKACLFICIVAAFVPAHAYAEEVGGNLDVQSEEFGKSFIPLAAQFGFTDYAYASKSDNGIILFQYLKPGDSLENWGHLASLSLLPIGEESNAVKEALPQYAEIFRSDPMIVLEKEQHDSGFGKIYFTHYEIGVGPMKENNLSVIWQIMPGVIANFQVQKRPDEPTQQDVVNFKNFIAAMIHESHAPPAEGNSKNQTQTNEQQTQGSATE